MSSTKFLLLMVVVISATTVILCYHMMFKAAAMMMCSLMVVSATMMMRAMTVVSAKCSNGFSEKSTAEEVTEAVDGSGLTAIITGASSGIGAETARVFALRGIQVVMGVRKSDVVAAENVKEAILKQIPTAKIDIMELDLSSLESVRNFASNYKASGLPLNILVNNAGMMGPFKLSKDEIELTFATNYLGHFLLTNILLETMKETAHESKKQGRIVIVASEGHRFTYRGGICFDKINSPSRYNKVASYGQSKLAIILYANVLARRLKEDGSNVIVNSLHPGMVDTSFITLKKIVYVIAKKIVGSRLKTVQQGAATTCYVALHPQVKGLSGEYFMNSNLSKASSLAMDMDLGKKLWDFSMNLVNKHKDS